MRNGEEKWEVENGAIGTVMKANGKLQLVWLKRRQKWRKTLTKKLDINGVRELLKPQWMSRVM